MSSLKKELLKAGAKKEEIKDLTNISKLLASTNKPKLSDYTIKSIENIPGSKEKRSLMPIYVLSTSFGVLLFTVLLAQSAMPGNMLYNFKRSSEDLRTIIQPNYIDNVVEKREEELETLKKENAPKELIEKAEEAKNEAINKYERRSKNRREKDQKSDRRRDKTNWSDREEKDSSNYTPSYRNFNQR